MAFWDGTRWTDEPKPWPRYRSPSVVRAARAAGAVAALLVALTVSGASAGKAESTVWVNELSAGSTLAATGLSLGDHFSVGYTTRETEPFALARCYPNATTEYIGMHADGSIWGEVFSVYDGGPTPQAFQLGASVYPLWTGGGADCTVELVKYSRNLSRMTVLATTSFTAAP